MEKKITNITPSSGKKAVELTWREQEVIKVIRSAQGRDVITVAVNPTGRVWSVNVERHDRTILECLQAGSLHVAMDEEGQIV